MEISAILALIAIVIVIAALGGSWWVLFRMRRLEQRLDQFLQGKDGMSLEGTLREYAQASQKHEKDIEELFQAAEYLQRAIQLSVRKVAFERYNPFSGIGGNQSFTVALLDANNAGVIITSLHGREGTRVYAKSVRDGRSLQNLSNEEEQVLKNAVAMKGV